MRIEHAEMNEAGQAVQLDWTDGLRARFHAIWLRDNAFEFTLAPGELFVVDNRRVLHGRRAFSSHGRRHIQGCYADTDSLQSRLRVLQSELGTNMQPSL